MRITIGSGVTAFKPMSQDYEDNLANSILSQVEPKGTKDKPLYSIEDVKKLIFIKDKSLSLFNHTIDFMNMGYDKIIVPTGIGSKKRSEETFITKNGLMVLFSKFRAMPKICQHFGFDTTLPLDKQLSYIPMSKQHLKQLDENKNLQTLQEIFDRRIQVGVQMEIDDVIDLYIPGKLILLFIPRDAKIYNYMRENFKVEEFIMFDNKINYIIKKIIGMLYTPNGRDLRKD